MVLTLSVYGKNHYLFDDMSDSRKEKSVSGKIRQRKPVELSRRAMWGWGAFAVLSGVWLFVLGVIVGRGTTPFFEIDSFQQELARIASADAQNGHNGNERPIPRKLTDKDFDFYVDLKSSGVKTALPGHENEPPVKKVAFPGEKKALPKRYISVAETQPARAPEPETPAKPVRSAPEKKKSDGRYTIQVAAFKNAEDAEIFAGKLLKKGYDAYSVSGRTPDNSTWYRVRVGSFNAKNDALPTLKKLENDKMKSMVIKK